MAGHAGIDTRNYPGDTVMQNLLTNTNLAWTGFYLTPAPSQGHALGWVTQRSALVGMGWGLAPIYVGQQDPAVGGNNSTNLTSAQGIIDAQDAVNLASNAGFPAGSVIYLDIEVGGPLTQANLDYVGAWVQDVFTLGYTAGVYGNAVSHVTNEIRALDARAILWGINLNKFSCQSAGGLANSTTFANPNPGDCGDPDASLWQYVWGCTINDGAGNSVTVDLDTCLALDPSTLATPPSMTVPVVTGVSPSKGGVGGNYEVGIQGSGFTGLTAVGFGGTDAPNVIVDSDVHITVVAPPGNGPGPVDVIVDTPAGSSAVSPDDQFVYQ
jgi:hypothetical protein